MRQHYVLAYAGPGAADGRAAQVIEVRRPAGGVAARYWLDRATGLPLRRELYDQRARVVAEVAFAQLRLGPAPAGAMPSAAARPWPGELTAARRAALRAAGWPLPRALAGGLSLFAATQTATPLGPGGRAVLLRRAVRGVGLRPARAAARPDAGLAAGDGGRPRGLRHRSR